MSRIPLVERSNMASVSRQFLEVFHHPSLWRTLKVSHLVNCSGMLNALALHRHHIEKMVIKHFGWKVPEEVKSEVVKSIGALTNLRFLWLEKVDQGAPDPLFNSPYELERRRAAHPNVFDHLDVTYSKIPCKITDLHIQNCLLFSAKSFLKFISSAKPQLLHLTLNNCFVHHKNYTDLFSTLEKNIGDGLLSFECDAYINDKGLGQEISEIFPRLQILKIPYFVGNQDHLMNLKDLSVLHLARHEKSNDDVLEGLERMVRKNFEKNRHLFKEKEYRYHGTNPYCVTSTEAFECPSECVDLKFRGPDRDDHIRLPPHSVHVFINPKELPDSYRGAGLHWGEFKNISECSFIWKVGSIPLRTLHKFLREAGLVKKII